MTLQVVGVDGRPCRGEGGKVDFGFESQSTISTGAAGLRE